MTAIPQNFEDFVQQLSFKTAGYMVANATDKKAPALDDNFHTSLINAVANTPELRMYLNEVVSTMAQNEHTPRKDNAHLGLNTPSPNGPTNDEANVQPAWYRVDKNAFRAANPFMNPGRDADEDSKLQGDVNQARASQDNINKAELTQRLSMQITPQLKMALEQDLKFRNTLREKLQPTPRPSANIKPSLGG
jgi:hypothetical protein